MLPEAEKVEHLRRIKLMAGLVPDELKMIARIVPDETYGAGQVIFRMGDPADHLFLLKKGRVKIIKYTADGKEKILDIVEPGNIFGEHLVTEGDYQEEAVALEDVLICKMVRSRFLQLLQEKPQLALNFIHLVCQRVTALQSEIEEMSFSTTRRRLAKTLLNLADRHGSRLGRWLDADRVKLTVALSHEDLAHLLGSNRPHVSEIMSEFHKTGLIGYEKRYLVVHRKKLESYLESPE